MFKEVTMSSFVGYVNLKNSFELDKNIIKKMKDTLSTDELDENNFYTDENICISQSKKITENLDW